ncbi:MAG: PAS domain S-box protein [Gammaproteobacteria bacterium]
MTQASDPKTEIYRLALHTAPIGIMVVGDQGDIQYANQTLADMFGYGVEDLLSKPVEILIPEPFVVAH